MKQAISFYINTANKKNLNQSSPQDTQGRRRGKEIFFLSDLLGVIE